MTPSMDVPPRTDPRGVNIFFPPGTPIKWQWQRPRTLQECSVCGDLWPLAICASHYTSRVIIYTGGSLLPVTVAVWTLNTIFHPVLADRTWIWHNVIFPPDSEKVKSVDGVQHMYEMRAVSSLHGRLHGTARNARTHARFTNGSFMRINDEARFLEGVRSAVAVVCYRTVTTNERVHCQPAELLRRNKKCTRVLGGERSGIQTKLLI